MWIKLNEDISININHYGSMEIIEQPDNFYRIQDITGIYFTLAVINEQRQTDWYPLIVSRTKEHCVKVHDFILLEIEKGTKYFDLHDFLADTIVKNETIKS